MRNTFLPKYAVTMAKKKERISVGGERDVLAESPFSMLSSDGLPIMSASPEPIEKPTISRRKSKLKQVRMRREKMGRGGKEVTVLWDFAGLPDGERKPLLDTIKRRCGTGGKLVGQALEVQGDQREYLTTFFEGHGFRVIWAGG